jgi:hypothetical protein
LKLSEVLAGDQVLTVYEIDVRVGAEPSR